MASGSFPGGFPWTTIRDRAYWDGGLTDNTPLKPVLDNLTASEAASMPIYMIDVNVAAAPRPASLYGVSQRMLELLVDNRLRSDLDTAASYTRFISVLKQADEQLPSDAPIRKEPEWEEAMTYQHIRHIHLIDVKSGPRTAPGTSPASPSCAGSAQATTRPGPPWRPPGRPEPYAAGPAKHSRNACPDAGPVRQVRPGDTWPGRRAAPRARPGRGDGVLGSG